MCPELTLREASRTWQLFVDTRTTGGLPFPCGGTEECGVRRPDSGTARPSNREVVTEALGSSPRTL